MIKKVKLTLSVYMALAVVTACTHDIPNNPGNVSYPVKSNQFTSKYNVSGIADFSSSVTKGMSIKATLTDVGTAAVVSILYPPDDATNPNVTVATGLTDTSGVFSINPDVGFTPTNGDIFVLEASKRIGTAKDAVMTIRTYIKRKTGGWDSITYPGLYINKKTTALTIIDKYDSGITPADTISTINVTSSGSTPSQVGSVTVSTINEVADYVTSLLGQNEDPTRHINYQNSKYYVIRPENLQKQGLIDTNKCPNCDLSYQDISNLSLVSPDLSNANLNGANFQNSNLNGGSLTGATYTSADFTGATWTDGSICQSGSIGFCSLEFRVNTYITGNQSLSSVSMDNSGNFVVTWQSNNQDGYGDGVYGQRYTSTGSVAGSEFRVNTYTTGNQNSPSVAMDNSGNFVVTWQSNAQDGSNNGIYIQRYTSTGSVAGSEFQVNTYTTSNQSSPSVAMDNSGNFVVTWQSNNQDGYGDGVYGQRYTSTGSVAGSEFRVNTYTTGNQNSPSVAMDNSGNFVVTWQSNAQDGSNNGIYGQRYDSTGATVGSEFPVNTYTTSHQRDPSVSMDNSGNFVVTWYSNSQDGSSYGIYGQRYTSTGSVAGSEFPVNTYTTSNQSTSSVAMDSTGNFVVTWRSNNQDGSSNGIYGQRYDSTGATVGSEFKVNTYTTSNQISASVSIDNNGNFVVTWQSNAQDGSGYGVYGQRYDSTGEAR